MANHVQIGVNDPESPVPPGDNHGSADRLPSRWRPTSRPILWLFTATVSLLTTKRLLEHDFHFPMHLLCLQLIGATGFKLVNWTYERIHRRQPLQDTSQDSTSELLTRLFFAVCVSVSLLCGYQAIHHFFNLPVVVMVLSLDWRSVPGAGASVSRYSRAPCFALQALFFVGIGLVLVCDFRLTQAAITLLLLSAVSSQRARLVLARIEEGNEELRWPEWFRKTGHKRFPTLDNSMLTLLCAILFAMFWCRFREQQFTGAQVSTYHPWTSDTYTLIVNLVSSSIALNSPGYLFKRCIGGPKDVDAEHSIDRATMSVALVNLVAIGRICWSESPPVLSPWQWTGFALASFACMAINRHNDLCAMSNSQSEEALGLPLNHREDLSNDKSSTNLLPSSAVTFQSIHLSTYLAVLIFVGLSLFGLVYDSRTARTAPNPSLRIPPHPLARSATAFDIVVARYNEPASEIATHIIEVLGLPNVQPLDASVRIYNKAEATDDSTILRSELQSILLKSQLAPKILVESLPNVGRESDSYLYHLISNWENLANHTLFVQAAVHRPNEYIRRIEDYFVPSTGFLSLGKADGYCSSCDGCHDRDWTEEPAVMKQLYSDFNSGAECKDVVLTYRGQFIASAARIRANKKKTYQQWLQDLRDPRSPLHTAPYTDSPTSRKKDVMSAPRVGFTLERSWGVVFQCNQKRIADRCPSLLSGLVRPPLLFGGPVVQDCQCLD